MIAFVKLRTMSEMPSPLLYTMRCPEYTESYGQLNFCILSLLSSSSSLVLCCTLVLVLVDYSNDVMVRKPPWNLEDVMVMLDK